MPKPIILASGSMIRAELLKNAGVSFEVVVPRLDEESIRRAAQAEDMSPRDTADLLADAKARKVSGKNPNAIVIGCDQILSFGDKTYTKPENPSDAIRQLQELSGKTHTLFSAAVIYEDSRSVWRMVGKTELTMRRLNSDYLRDYVQRNWNEIRHTAGCYQIEKEGARLFSGIKGDYFNILGLPLIELLAYLTEKGELPG